MFNPTTPRWIRWWTGRRTRTIFISALLYFANSFCMEEINKPNPAIPFDSNGKAIVAEKNGISRLPKEIILEIIKFLFDTSQNELDQYENVVSISFINKFFKALLEENSNVLQIIWANEFNKLEKIKKEFYVANDLKWASNRIKIEESNYAVSAKLNLLKKLKEFANNKHANVTEARRSNKKTRLRLIYAAQNGNADLLRLILGLKANIINFKTKAAVSLIEAVRNRHKDIAQILINKGADIEAKYEDGMTMLMDACAWGHADVVHLLLSNGARVDSITKDKGYCHYYGIAAYGTYAWTPLMFAAKYCEVQVIKILFKYGAEVNSKDKYGHTPLMIAAYAGKIEAVRFLLENGADVTIIDNSKRTALHWAKDYPKIQKLIKNHIKRQKKYFLFNFIRDKI